VINECFCSEGNVSKFFAGSIQLCSVFWEPASIEHWEIDTEWYYRRVVDLISA